MRGKNRPDGQGGARVVSRRTIRSWCLLDGPSLSPQSPADAPAPHRPWPARPRAGRPPVTCPDSLAFASAAPRVGRGARLPDAARARPAAELSRVFQTAGGPSLARREAARARFRQRSRRRRVTLLLSPDGSARTPPDTGGGQRVALELSARVSTVPASAAAAR